MSTNLVDDDLPIAVRRKRRSSLGLRAINTSKHPNTSTSEIEGIETPPLTPVKKKKRVRFSYPGPSSLAEESSTGLTPAVQRSSLGSKTKSKPPNRRHSAPSTSWNLDFSNRPPLSGTQQFAPLRQVLDGRVKRRLRRNGLSEEINNIESEKKSREKSRTIELSKLRAELQNRDREMQHMRDEWDLRSQFGDEVGNSQSTQMDNRIRDLESQISTLKTELERREIEPSQTNDEPNWTFAAQDPFHNYDDDDDETMPLYDNEFDDTTNMNDIISSTPTRRSFPSPPSTLPNTPNVVDEPLSHTPSHTTAGIQADFVDPERKRLEEQLAKLQADLTRLSAAMENTNNHHSRLSSKLSEFFSSENSNSDPSNLDAALDTLLTRLALSQCSLSETNATLDALRTEIYNLGFSTNSSPDEIIALIASQFRQARLDLEYMNPGEITIGFQNQYLLKLLVERIKVLLKEVKSRDDEISHSREQLDGHVGSLELLRKDLADSKTKITGLNDELSWQTCSNEKLKKALEGYREEVKGLEELVGRMETDHSDAESQLKTDLQAAVRRAEGLEAEVESYKIEQQASRTISKGKELLLEEFKAKLDSALKKIDILKTEMKAHVTKKDAEMAQLTANKDRELEALKLLMTQREDEKEEDFIADVAAREQRVEDLSNEYEGLRHALGAANSMIDTLEHEKSQLETRIRDERGRANGVVMVMREQLKNALNVGLGFLEQSDGEEDEMHMAPTAIVRPGKFLNGKLARRRSSGGNTMVLEETKKIKSKSKWRRYDSGLGFLEEEEEMEMETHSKGYTEDRPMAEGGELMEM